MADTRKARSPGVFPGGRSTAMKTSGVGLSGLALVVVGLIIGLWAGSVDRTTASSPAVANNVGRFRVATGENGTFLVDTENGDTWTLVGTNASAPVYREWRKLDVGKGDPRPGSR
jgi:hypothetical protein